MTAGQQLHVNNTLAQLGPPFTYGVPHQSVPHTYGYGNSGATWELFEQVDPTTCESKWCAAWRLERPDYAVLLDPQTWTAGRWLPPETDWKTLGESLAWLVAQTLTHGEHNPDEGDAK